jgi:hypothetical protein
MRLWRWSKSENHSLAIPREPYSLTNEKADEEGCHIPTTRHRPLNNFCGAPTAKIV